VSPFAKNQRAQAAAIAFVNSKTARRGKIIEDNNITMKQLPALR